MPRTLGVLVPSLLSITVKVKRLKSKRMLSGFLIAKCPVGDEAAQIKGIISWFLPVAELDPGVGPGPQRYWPTTRIGRGS